MIHAILNTFGFGEPFLRKTFKSDDLWRKEYGPLVYFDKSMMSKEDTVCHMNQLLFTWINSFSPKCSDLNITFHFNFCPSKWKNNHPTRLRPSLLIVSLVRSIEINVYLVRYCFEILISNSKDSCNSK